MAAVPTTAAENARAGTTRWYAPHPSQERIAGYAGSSSYLRGQTVRLFVDSHGRPFRYRVFRLGWYRGESGRLVASGRVDANRAQASPRILDDRMGGAKLLVTGWRASLSFRVGASWPSGFYLVRLDLDGGAGTSYASFVVRDSTPGPIVVVLSTNTWQAYNTWGGVSLYRDLRLHGDARWSRPGVGHVVTSLRPYVQGYGAGDVFRYDLPLLRWLERNGYPISYVTDRDVSEGHVAGADTRLVIISGHPEYHDVREQKAFVHLVERGVSLAILGGNSFGWHARLDHHDEHLSVWRERRLDPHPGPTATVHWISLGWNPRDADRSAWRARSPRCAPARACGRLAVGGRLGTRSAGSRARGGVRRHDGNAIRRSTRRCSPRHRSRAAHNASRGRSSSTPEARSCSADPSSASRGNSTVRRCRRSAGSMRPPRRGRSTTIRCAPWFSDPSSDWSRT